MAAFPPPQALQQTLFWRESVRHLACFMDFQNISRRRFIKYLSAGAAALASSELAVLAIDGEGLKTASHLLGDLDFDEVPISSEDKLLLPEGFEYEVLLKQGDLLNERGDRYGDNNDFLGITTVSPEAGWLWVNHEAAFPQLIDDDWSDGLSKEKVDLILLNIGGSCIRVTLNKKTGCWRPVLPDSKNFRVDGLQTQIQLTGPAAGSKWVNHAMTVTGSVGNCGGGISPWGTFFSGEEAFSAYWGDPEMGDEPSPLASYYQRPSQHYGYMLEIDPDTQETFKHTSLGRFSHENIAFAFSKDGRLVAYMGDDQNNQCIYKYISQGKYEPKRGKQNRSLLNDGTLHVANTKKGRWLPLDPKQVPSLREEGFDIARACVHTRTAASLCGGTPLARPEEIEVHPVTGDVYAAITAYTPPVSAFGLTNLFGSLSRAPMGAIARIREENADAASTNFQFEIFVTGGSESGLLFPDNLAFAGDNYLMATTDFPGMRGPYAAFGNNFLAIMPTSGQNEGQLKRFAVCPRDAEFCSPALSPSSKELWVNVQHPGKNSKGPDKLSSHWPDGGHTTPKSALVAIRRT